MTPTTPVVSNPAAKQMLVGGPKNAWMAISIILGIVVLVLVFNSTKGSDSSTPKQISKDEAGTILLNFVNEVYGTQIAPVTLKEVVEKNGLYQATINALDPQTGQLADQIVYISKDGVLFVPQVFEFEDIKRQFRALQQQAVQQQQQVPINQETVPAASEGGD